MQAMAFTDATVVGITLLMLLGAVGYYLYHRIDMLDRKIGLMENILLDLKVATEQTLLSSSEPPERDSGPRMGLYSELSESYEQQHHFRPPTPRGEEEVFLPAMRAHAKCSSMRRPELVHHLRVSRWPVRQPTNPCLCQL